MPSAGIEPAFQPSQAVSYPLNDKGDYLEFQNSGDDGDKRFLNLFSLRYCRRYLLICSGSALPSNITVWVENVFDSKISSFYRRVVVYPEVVYMFVIEVLVSQRHSAGVYLVKSCSWSSGSIKSDGKSDQDDQDGE